MKKKQLKALKKLSNKSRKTKGVEKQKTMQAHVYTPPTKVKDRYLVIKQRTLRKTGAKDKVQKHAHEDWELRKHCRTTLRKEESLTKGPPK